jgi:hypothetical protein
MRGTLISERKEDKGVLEMKNLDFQYVPQKRRASGKKNIEVAPLEKCECPD